MYRVYCDDLPLYDTRDDDLTLIAPVVNLEDNASGSFDFSINPKHPRYDDLKKLTSEIKVMQDDEEMFCGRIIEEKGDFHKRKSIHCEGELSYLNDSIQEPREFNGITVRQFLEQLLNIHNKKVPESKKFYVGTVTVTDPNNSVYKYSNWETTLDVIKSDLLKTYGGHLRIRKVNGKRYLDYLKDYPRTSEQVIRFGENLLDFTKNFDMSDICTVVIPLGAKQDESPIPALESYLTIESVNGGKNYLVNEEARKIYGTIEKVVKFNDVHVPANLKKKGQDFLNDSQYTDMVLEIKAVDLHNLDVNFDRIKLLDEVRAYSLVHGFDKFFPVTKMKIPLDNPAQAIFTLGIKVKQSMTSMNNDSHNEVLDEINKIPTSSSIVQEAVDNATQLIQSALNGHVVTRANEQLIMDTDDINTARKVWRWNLNGLGYSNTGYNGTYSTAITMDGQIVGDRLVGGSVSAEKIDITYRSNVEKSITNAELNSKKYTDGELKNYYTKSQIETSIKNTKESVLLSAKETAEAYVDGRLVNYVTSSQFTVKTNTIESEVSKKVNNSDFGTKISQNAYYVRMAWNNNSRYIQFENSALNIYDISNQKLMSLTYNGNWFYYKGTKIGKIGTNNFQGEDYFRGLVFDLEYDASYMCWAAKDSSSGLYSTKLIYYHKPYGSIRKGLHFNCDTYSNGYLLLADDVRVIDWSNGGCGIRGEMTWCNSSNTSCVEINGMNKSFKIYNNVDVDIYSNIDMHNWDILNQSDARMKKNIQDCSINALELLNNIELKEFDWVQSNEHEPIGIIAQQLEEFAPQLVEEKDGHLNIKTTKLIYYLIKAIQELSGRKEKRTTWKDPYTLLDKKVFCAKLNAGSQIREEKKHEPMQIPMRKGM